MNGDIPSVPIITLAGVSSLTNGINFLFLNLIYYTNDYFAGLITCTHTHTLE